MKMAVSEFKAHCTQVLREVADEGQTVQVTRHGKIVAIVSPPLPHVKPSPKNFWGSLHGSVIQIAPDFDAPLGDKDWEAAQ